MHNMLDTTVRCLPVVVKLAKFDENMTVKQGKTPKTQIVPFSRGHRGGVFIVDFWGEAIRILESTQMFVDMNTVRIRKDSQNQGSHVQSWKENTEQADNAIQSNIFRLVKWMPP